jgi:hypothetical protein
MNCYIKKSLPMEDFAKGNFANAFKIIDVYNNYLAKCLDQETKKQTEDNPSIDAYLESELEKLNLKHKELSDQKKQKIQEIKNTKEKIETEKSLLKKEKEEKNNQIFNYFYNAYEKS